ncbi:class I SAM-dependent methyltransferase [Actinomadura sp. ATCC 31491]|uniref:Class I SAM-dependent methyltransferase n=1 Tax=Actinomadura luzonensis TaxID=2805427 RepID=A0ABT0FZ34_9ACTN|nr:class I SAM-dependent methyltransferase [Actinomadura luzonensis]MCK2217610.1 class I SAM-dependent methyltransferase [Actinomadura luzonensis]
METRFGGAAPYYARYRADHGDVAIERLAAAFGPDGTVLDLGCGPGTVAIPLAPRVREVLAVDPDPDMPAEGRRLAAHLPNVRWLPGDSTTLRDLPPFDHVVMGRSFHWMDRRAVLGELDRLLPPGGVVALVGPGRRPPEEPWEPAMRRVRDRFGLGEMTASSSYQATGEHHHDVLADSPFADLTLHTDERVLTRDLDGVLGLQLSYSFSSPARLGDRLEAFVEEARRELVAENPSGEWRYVRQAEVLLARRPSVR